MHLTEGFLKDVLPEAVVLHGTLDCKVTFSVDSRSIIKNELFVPIQGEKADGHAFLANALQKGAGALIARDKRFLLDALPKDLWLNRLIIIVNNPLEALFALASAWRSNFLGTVIGITGSIGKTSTKYMLGAMFAQSGKHCFVSHGNQNTLIGIALNMVRLTDQHTIAIFEMGINKTSEMNKLAQLLKPDSALITGVGHSHLQGLGTLARVASEKRAIFSYFNESSIGIINGDQPSLSSVGYTHPVIRFGTKTTNQIQARRIVMKNNKLEFVLKIYQEKYNVTLNVQHRGMIINALAAAAVAHHFGVDGATIVTALQELPERSQRFERCALKGYRGMLIDDCYNASPESMRAALLALEEFETTGKKIAVLGDMLELGENSAFWHRQVGRFLRKVSSLSHLILVGSEVQWMEKVIPVGIEVEKVSSWQEAVERLKYTLENDAVVLVKGSRGMQLHNVVAAFTDKKSSIPSI
ncbi:MAG: UDP-N-acetylmuramoyl-tripeptide--D-alanyl-D-alanine ligase [Alteromonas naphthalenivorans]|jgi:UDP-N-acetylmuramoyl-tripeptide--D-alanyl-D-alanine ligase